MFGVEKKRKRRKKTNYQGKAIQSFTELSVGDYVVHEEHGLGIYKGIEKVERDKVIKDISRLSMGTAAICICRPHVWRASRNTQEQRPRNLSSTSWEGPSGIKPRPGSVGLSRRLPRIW